MNVRRATNHAIVVQPRYCCTTQGGAPPAQEPPKAEDTAAKDAANKAAGYPTSAEYDANKVRLSLSIADGVSISDYMRACVAIAKGRN